MSGLPPETDPRPLLVQRLVALLEVVLCSGLPTQLAIGGTLATFGYGAYDPSGGLNIQYVVGLSLLDAFVVIGFVFFFLFVHGERPRDVIVGRRLIVGEIAAGIPMVFIALALAVLVVLVTRHAAPWLHTVETNPLQNLLATPRDAWLFAFVVVVAGGVREEVQRAFVLHRFDVWLGGGATGVVITSIAFGAGHIIQGADAAIATGLLGAFWGVVYLRRRSAIAPIVSHAGFDLLQILGFVAARRI